MLLLHMCESIPRMAFSMQGSGREIVRGSASCGFGPIGPESWPDGAVAQISSSNSLQQVTNVCGACLEVGTHATRLFVASGILG